MMDVTVVPPADEPFDQGPSEFGKWLNAERLKKEFSVQELGEKSGVSVAQIYNIESGNSQNPRDRTRQKLATALETQLPEEVVRTTEEGAMIPGLGEFSDFDPHDKADRPAEPGIMDLPCWEGGRNWCRPSNPKCDCCYMRDVCPTGTKHLG